MNGTDLIRSPEELYNIAMTIGGIVCLLLFIGIVLETLVIVTILRVGHKSVDTLFVLSLCFADILFNLYMLPSVLIVMVANGWSTGKLT